MTYSSLRIKATISKTWTHITTNGKIIATKGSMMTKITKTIMIEYLFYIFIIAFSATPLATKTATFEDIPGT